MRLLQINSVYGYGSTGRIVKDIHQASLEMGIDSYVAYGRGQHKGDRLIKIGSKKDLIYHGLKTRFFDQHGLASKNATRKFIEQIKNLELDIIHLHNIHGYYLNYPLLFEYLKSVEIKVIWTMHDCWAYTGHCSYYSYVECNKWETHCQNCPQLNKYPKSLGIDNSFHNFEQKKSSFIGVKNLNIITPSNWLKDELERSFLKDYNIVTIFNGVDNNIFKARKSNLKKVLGIENKKVILGVANVWDERKGLNYFRELSKIIDENEVIILVGIEVSDCKNIISFRRTKDARKLSEIYSAADIFFNPTLEEVLGLVNLEAIACGTPVITFNSGGASETITPNTGAVIHTRDIAEIYQTIKASYNLKETMQLNSNVSFRNKFQKENSINGMIKYYNNLLN